MSRSHDFHDLPYSTRVAIQASEMRVARLGLVASYWRNAYEMLVKQTGRDLNDGLGLDPRSRPTEEGEKR